MSDLTFTPGSGPQGLAMAIEPIPDPVPVDATDLRILRLLALDSRASQRSLARTIGMSAPAVADRIARLERLGVIRGYSVTIDWARLGYPMEAFLSVLTVNGSNMGELMTELNALPEVESVNSVSGTWDLQARVRVRDHSHLARLLINRIWQIPALQRTDTQISFASAPHWDFAVTLLGHLLRQAEAGTRRRSGRTSPTEAAPE